MDELWGNAWSDPQHDKPLELPKSESPPSWERPSIYTSQKPIDDEVDLGVQSWTPHNVTVKWSDGEETSPQNTTDISWANMTLRKTPSFSNSLPTWESETQTADKQVTSNVNEQEHIPQWEPEPPTASVEDDVEQEAEVEEEEDYVDPITSPRSVLRSPSPDNFGTFETGLDSTPPETKYVAENWQTPAIPMEEDGWGSSWAHATQNEFRSSTPGSEEQPVSSAVPVSDWDRAQQKATPREPVHVPIQLLTSLIEDWGELATELWEGFEPVTEKRRIDTRTEWQGGLENVEGLNSLVRRVLPDDQSLQKIQFAQTNVSKSLQSALRLTKSFPLAQRSPLSQLFASKGSTAWEASVMKRKEKSSYDQGWTDRIPGLDDEELVLEAKPESRGILSSFFGRKSSASGLERKPATPLPYPAASSSVPSRRTSQSRSSSQVPSPVPSPALPSQVPQPPPQAPLEASISVPLPVSPPAEIPGTPSAVSRFLGRFSRAKSTSPRSSLSLSSTDLSHPEEAPVSSSYGIFSDEEDDFGLSTSQTASSSSQTFNPLPLPIAPPPKRTPIPSRSPTPLGYDQPSSSRSTHAKDLFYGHDDDDGDLAPLSEVRKMVNAQRKDQDDLMSAFFGGPATAKPATTSSRFSIPTGFVLLPPTLASTPSASASIPQPTSFGAFSDLDDFFTTPQKPTSTRPTNNVMPSNNNLDSSFGDFMSSDISSPPNVSPRPPTPPTKSPPHVPTLKPSTVSSVAMKPRALPITKDKPKPIALMSRSNGPASRPNSTAPLPVILPPPPGFRPRQTRAQELPLQQDDLLSLGDSGGFHESPLKVKSGEPVAFDFFDGNGRSLLPSPPPSAHTPPLSFSPFVPIHKVSSPSPVINPPPQSNQKGLSAQDLSFFEGL